MDQSEAGSAAEDKCTQPGGHVWEFVRADRVPHQFWPPCADLHYRCGHCGSRRQVRQTLRH
jgi:hypothetical protein